MRNRGAVENNISKGTRLFWTARLLLGQFEHITGSGEKNGKNSRSTLEVNWNETNVINPNNGIESKCDVCNKHSGIVKSSGIVFQKNSFPKKFNQEETKNEMTLSHLHVRQATQTE